MHSLLYYELRTPSYDAHWQAQARALADLHADRPVREARAHSRFRWFARRPRHAPLGAGC
jgi:hypothetical protein